MQEELFVRSNEAYETVELHYDDYHNRRPQHEVNEDIYVQPVL